MEVFLLYNPEAGKIKTTHTHNRMKNEFVAVWSLDKIKGGEVPSDVPFKHFSFTLI